MSSSPRSVAFAAAVGIVISGIAAGPVGAQASVGVSVQTPECGDAWSETRFLDILRIELQPFAELVGEGAQSEVHLSLRGDCQTRVIVELEGRPGASIVSLEDVPDARERAVAMASARLVELSLSSPVSLEGFPGSDIPASDVQVGDMPLSPSASAQVLREGGTALPVPVPQRRASESMDVTRSADATEGSATNATPVPQPSRRNNHLSAGPTLLWLPVGGASFGLDVDVDVALAFRGPFFFVAGAGFTQSRSTHEPGVVRLVRLDASVGLGVRWQPTRWGLEGRVLGRGGWIRLAGESTSASTAQTQDALSLGLQLDAGIALQLGRIGFVLRGGPLFIVSGLTAESTAPDRARSYVSLRGVLVVASASLRVSL